MKWTCFGAARGGCGHTHRSREAADRCCEHDAAGVRQAYPSQYPTRAYSDRTPKLMDNEARAERRGV